MPSAIHGTISSNYLDAASALSGQIGDPGNCILNLPDSGSQITLKADSVAMASAQLGKGGFHQRKEPGGEVCWESFTIPNEPGGKSTYAITVSVSNSGAFASGGCSGTVYYTAARLSSGKPLNLSC